MASAGKISSEHPPTPHPAPHIASWERQLNEVIILVLNIELYSLEVY